MLNFYISTLSYKKILQIAVLKHDGVHRYSEYLINNEMRNFHISALACKKILQIAVLKHDGVHWYSEC